MKNIIKPFSYTLIASAIAVAFNQPVFASNIQNSTVPQQSWNLNKDKGKLAVNIQQQNKKSIAKTNSAQSERSEIEGIAYEQKIAFHKAEEQRKQAEVIAITRAKQEQQRRLAEKQKKAQEDAYLIAREYQEAKRVAQQQEITRQQVEEARQKALTGQRKKLEATRIEHERLVLEQQRAHKKAEEIARQRALEEQQKQAELVRRKNEMIAREQEVARQKIEAAALQKAIDEQRKKAEVARIKREEIIREQNLAKQKLDDKLRQQVIEEQRQKEEQARIEQERLEAKRVAREQEIARQKAEESRKKSEEMARRERERLAREQDIARQNAEEEERQRVLEEQRRKEEAARIEREHQETERIAREEKLTKQKAEEERKQAEEVARIEQQRIIEAERVAREQEIARQKAEEERKQAEETDRIEQQRAEAERLAREQDIIRQKAEEERKQAEGVNQIAKAQDSIPEMSSDGEILSAEQHPEITETETEKEVQSVSVQPESEGQTVNELVGNKQPPLMLEESTVPTNESPENTQTEAGIIEDVVLEAQLPPELLRAGEALTVQLPQEETPQYNEAQQTQALANRQKEMATANAMVSDMSIITALNLDLAGRMDRRLDRTNFYRPLGGVWVEYANNDVHAHNGDYRNYRSKSSQITLGNDEAELDNGVILGGTLTHAKNSNKYGSLNGSGHLTMLTAYAKQNFDEYSKAIDISYGWSSSKIADSKFKRKIISVGMNFAYDFEFDDFKVTPIWGLRYHRVSATGGEVNGITVKSPSLSLVAYHAGVKVSSTFNLDGLEVTPAFSSYYVTTLGKSYGQNINGQEFQQKVGTYFYNNVSLSVGIQDWKVSAYAGFNHGKHGEKQNQLGVKLSYYW